MTRLTHDDIRDISSGLARYERELQASTGKTVLGIASHTVGWGEAEITSSLSGLQVHVIPVTAGQGVITGFSRTVADILSFLGCHAVVTDRPDASGLAAACEGGADAVFLADDNRFVGIHPATRTVADNSLFTGRVFAAALDLMAGGLKNTPVLVMGCGPVGAAGAQALMEFGAGVVLYDIRYGAAKTLKAHLGQTHPGGGIYVAESVETGLAACACILEATPTELSIGDEQIRGHLRMAAPGVPLGISPESARVLGRNLIHDTLELGVAGMAAHLAVAHTMHQWGTTCRN